MTLFTLITPQLFTTGGGGLSTKKIAAARDPRLRSLPAAPWCMHVSWYSLLMGISGAPSHIYTCMFRAPVCRLDRVTSHVCEISDVWFARRDGIKWWANQSVKDSPNLARMARQYFGVPATSATVDRLFSVVGFAFADRRKRASAETLATTSSSLSSICQLQNFNDGGGAHVNDVWLFVIQHLRFAYYAIVY